MNDKKTALHIASEEGQSHENIVKLLKNQTNDMQFTQNYTNVQKSKWRRQIKSVINVFCFCFLNS